MITYINEYLKEMAETKSESTVKGHKSTLMKFNDYVKASEPIEVTIRNVADFRNEEYQHKKAGTVNTMLKRIKKFFNWCVDKGYIDISPAKDVKLLSEGQQLPKWLNDKEQELLERTLRKRFLGVDSDKNYRDVAIIYLMLHAGLRVSEVSNLKYDDIQILGKSGKALIRGKGQQQRTIHLIPEVVEVLKLYLKHHKRKGKYLFDSRRSDKISVRMIQEIISSLQDAKYKDVTLQHLTPHVLRHTFAHNLAQKGMNLEKIARLLGHFKQNGEPNIQQTIRYTKASDDEIGEELERLLSIK